MRSFALAICLASYALVLPAVASAPSEYSVLSNFDTRGLAEPLVPSWPTTQAEDQDLSIALSSFQNRSEPDELFALENFLEKHRKSGWSPSLLLNVGLAYKHFGYISRAEKALQSAWLQGRAAKDPEAKALIDKAAGELAILYASLGASDKLATLFEEIGSRSITGSATEQIQVARETLDLVKKDPRHLFNCGPLALRSLLIGTGLASEQADALRWYRASPNGTNLAEIAALATKAGFKSRLIRRKNDQSVPVPSIVHFKSGHFAALLAFENGRYHIFDPVFGGQDLWLTAGAVDSETSGYFLIPQASLPDKSTGWQEITLAEADQIWGKGPTNGVVRGDAGDRRANNSPRSSSAPPPPPSCGMCRYDIKESTVGLTLWDVPAGYIPAIGPKVQTRISYNQREDSQPAVFNYYNVGQKWTLNWITYVVDDPQNPGGNVSRTLPDGGAYYYTGYSSSNGSFDVESDDGSVLNLTSSQPVTYKRQLQDGTIEFYSNSDGSTGYPRRIFISKIVDPQGNTLSFDYDAQQRLNKITDALGRETTFGYTQPSRPLLVTQIKDPFGRSAAISYDLLGRLSSITDVIGLTSRFSYDANGLVNAMTTPYGTTTFNYTAPGTSSPPRFLDVTDPLGFHEREEWLEPAPIPDGDPTAVVPQGMPVSPVNEYLSYRNSFHWDRAAYIVAGCTVAGGCDYTKARIRHFVHASVGIKGVAVESEKYPLENRIWYNYPGQTTANFSGLFNKPSAVARVMDDGTTQIIKYEYDQKTYNLTRSTDPLGRVTQFTYAPNGTDLLAVTQVTGASTFATLAQFTYNGLHRPVVFTDASGQTSTYKYNTAGQLISSSNSLGEITSFNYDNFGNKLSIVNPNGTNAALFTYDGYDRVKTYTDSEGWAVSYEYDLADRVTAVNYPDGTSQAYTYDRLDLIKYRDREHRVWSYSYDANQRLVSLVDPSGGTVALGYSPDGKLNELTDIKGNRTIWTFDVQGRLTEKKYSDSSTITYIYEAATSRLKSITDALSQIKTYAYFLDDNVSNISYTNAVVPTPSVSFTQDPYFPRTLSMTDGTGTTKYSYAPGFALGAFKLEQECFAPTGVTSGCNWTIRYSYDELGRMNSRAVSGSGVEAVNYDVLGRVTAHTSDLGSFGLSYLGQTNQIALRELLPSTQNLKTAWSYLPNSGDRRLSGISNTGLSTSQYLNFQIASTPENTIAGISEISDASTTLPLAVSQTANFNALNQLYNFSGQTLSYDANGNLLSDGQRNYSWDAENRLVQIAYPSQPGKMSAFTYDGRNRRVAISTVPTNGGASSTTYYIWCDERICQSRNSDWTVLRSYVSEGEFAPSSQSQNNYYGVDQIGSVRRAFSNAGSSPAYDYDPYGTPLQNTVLSTDFSFAGMFYHAESGLYLTQYRAYNPNTDQWLSRDPLGEFADVAKNVIGVGAKSIIPSAFSYSSASFSADDLRPAVSAGDNTNPVSTFNSYSIFKPTALVLYEYARGNPISIIDPQGLASITCDGFPSGCSQGGSWGSTGMYCIGGKSLCFDCAVKYYSLDGLPRSQQLEKLRPFLIGGQ